MSSIVAVHSFRRGTGKSNLAANVAALLALQGQRVGIVDIDLLTPSQHILFQVPDGRLNHCLNDYLWGRCSIQQAAYDLTPCLGPEPRGALVLVPSRIRIDEIVRIDQGYDVERLGQGLETLLDEFGLDVLVCDGHAGINEGSLALLAMSDALALIVRLDKQDHQGTAVMVGLARVLDVPHVTLTVNQVLQRFDALQVKQQMERAYACPVAAVLPLSVDMLALGSAGIFALHAPDHPLTALYRLLASRWIGSLSAGGAAEPE